MSTILFIILVLLLIVIIQYDAISNYIQNIFYQSNVSNQNEHHDKLEHMTNIIDLPIAATLFKSASSTESIATESIDMPKPNVYTMFNKYNPLCESESKCSLTKCQILHPILDPRFNMRETAKQCLLLEDHLNNIRKRCYDCIRKHFLVIDGYLEEAVSLEKNNEFRDKYRALYLEWIGLEKQYATNPNDSNNLDDVSKKIRLFRKPLVEEYFDAVISYDE